MGFSGDKFVLKKFRLSSHVVEAFPLPAALQSPTLALKDVLVVLLNHRLVAMGLRYERFVDLVFAHCIYPNPGYASLTVGQVLLIFLTTRLLEGEPPQQTFVRRSAFLEHGRFPGGSVGHDGSPARQV